MSDPGDLLDIKQAARFLGVSETSLRRWTNAGALACLRVGRRRERRFRRADLVAFMEEQPASRVVTAPQAGSAEAHSTLIGGIPIPFGSHLIALYTDDVGRADLAAGFLAGGLGPGSVCYLVTLPDARDGVLTRLAQDRASLKREIREGWLVLLDHQTSAGRQLENFEAHFVAATRAGARSLRLVGDVGGLASSVKGQELVEFEAAYELLGRRFPLVTLCQYDVRLFSSFDIFSALQGHSDTFRLPVERLLS